jgi:hypothetical protein
MTRFRDLSHVGIALSNGLACDAVLRPQRHVQG